MGTHKKLSEIMKREEKIPSDIKQLEENLYKSIHGNTNINTQATKDLINKIILETQLYNSKVVSIDIAESPYNSLKDKGLDTPSLYITIRIDGKFNGEIYIETGSGYKSDTGLPIYYIMSSDRIITSNTKEKIMEYYEDTYKILIQELFLDTAVNKELYLNLEGEYSKYELWKRNPDSCCNTMQGYYADRNRYNASYERCKNLNKINQYTTFDEFLKDDGVDWHKESVDWKVYSL